MVAGGLCATSYANIRYLQYLDEGQKGMMDRLIVKVKRMAEKQYYDAF